MRRYVFCRCGSNVVLYIRIIWKQGTYQLFKEKREVYGACCEMHHYSRLLTLYYADLYFHICTKRVSTKIYDKRDDFDFDIVKFPFLDGDFPRRTSYGVYISQLIRFARASSNLNDFNFRNKALTAKLLRQGYRYFKLRKAFSKFYSRHSALLEKI